MREKKLFQSFLAKSAYISENFRQVFATEILFSHEGLNPVDSTILPRTVRV